MIHLASSILKSIPHYFVEHLQLYLDYFYQLQCEEIEWSIIVKFSI